MIGQEKESQDGGFNNSFAEQPQSTSSTLRESLVQKLKKGRDTRSKFVESHLDKTIAFQIRALRAKHDWTQTEFAEKLGIKHPNNVSARLENPEYGKHTLTTLKNIAATCDVALVVWFIPFSRLIDWTTRTPYKDEGLTPEFYDVPEFSTDPGLLPEEASAAVTTEPLDATAMLDTLKLQLPTPQFNKLDFISEIFDKAMSTALSPTPSGFQLMSKFQPVDAGGSDDLSAIMSQPQLSDQPILKELLPLPPTGERNTSQILNNDFFLRGA